MSVGESWRERRREGLAALRTACALPPDGDERAERRLAPAAECVAPEANVA